MQNGLCSKCHWTSEQGNKFRLPEFTILKHNYIVGRTLGAGGFGITYKSLDMTKNSICAIKEYAPIRISYRSISGNTLTPNAPSAKDFEEGKNRFCSEAKTLYKLNHINSVVKIYDFFFENNTAYFTMEYLQGLTLKTFVKNIGGRIPIDTAIKKITMVGKALSEVHKAGIFHRDISPDNIILTSSGTVKLIDFGSAKQLSTDSDESLSVLLKPGFAPPEQYS